jgi:negative regulator of flagellin synthesis FlgM
MKINPNLPISNPLPPSNRPLRSSSEPAVPNTHNDEATLSSSGASVEKLATELSSIPEVRQERVHDLKVSVADGTYQVSPQRIAAAMLTQATAKLR